MPPARYRCWIRSGFQRTLASSAQAVDVLVLSKDEQFLVTIKESTRGLHHVHTADTLAAAREALEKHSVGVLLVDAGMVGRNVEKLTVHLRKLSKRLVAIVAGRRDDGEMLMGLINRGTVYRFLLKPLSRAARGSRSKRPSSITSKPLTRFSSRSPTTPSRHPPRSPRPTSTKRRHACRLWRSTCRTSGSPRPSARMSRALSKP